LRRLLATFYKCFDNLTKKTYLSLIGPALLPDFTFADLSFQTKIIPMPAYLLVPTDFSDYAERALAYAVSLSQLLGSHIILHHNVEKVISSANNAYLSDKLYREKEAEAARKIQDLAAKYRGFVHQTDSTDEGQSVVEIEPSITYGNTEERIIEILKNNADISLLVMGTKGKSAVERIFMGSTTADMVEKAPISILVVPEAARFEGWENIVYAGDFDQADPKGVEIVSFLAQKLNAKLTYLHVSPDEESILADAQKLDALETQFTFTPAQLDFVLITEKSLRAGIDEYLEHQPIDILVMYRKQRGFFEKLWHRSRTKEMTFHSQVPILILKQK
jgi:nucleotide-binding universal stress UspA family protein